MRLVHRSIFPRTISLILLDHHLDTIAPLRVSGLVGWKPVPTLCSFRSPFLVCPPSASADPAVGSSQQGRPPAILQETMPQADK